MTGLDQVLAFTGGRSNTIAGPGYERINMSLFKNFSTWRERAQQLQLRVDAFNLFNHPSWANPSTTNNDNTGGLITGPDSFQNDIPDARCLQLSAKYIF